MSYKLLKPSVRGARPLTVTGKGKSRLLAGSDVARHCACGRYRLTGREGAFHVTDCRWEDEV